MKLKCLFVLFAILLATAAHGSTILPDTCGKDEVKFNVNRSEIGGKLPTISAGKAQLVFVTSFETHMILFPGGDKTIRVGMDGHWLGGAKRNSYLVAEIDPGEHHLCIITEDWTGTLKFSTFTAEPGKTYFFQDSFSQSHVGNGANIVTHDFQAIDEDEGRYRVKVLPESKPASKPAP